MDSGNEIPKDNGFSKNNLIVVLVILLGLSFLGINILAEGGAVVQMFTNTFGPLISQILSIFGYTAGNIINKSADVAADTAHLGIDIAEGTVQNVGNLLIPQRPESSPEPRQESRPEPRQESRQDPKQDSDENSIQKSIASSKMSWCLVGDYEGTRGCISVTDADKCMSGQMYPSQQMCINPNFSSNMQKN